MDRRVRWGVLAKDVGISIIAAASAGIVSQRWWVGLIAFVGSMLILSQTKFDKKPRK